MTVPIPAHVVTAAHVAAKKFNPRCAREDAESVVQAALAEWRVTVEYGLDHDEGTYEPHSICSEAQALRIGAGDDEVVLSRRVTAWEPLTTEEERNGS
jgi:hypothetical protein